MSHGYGLDISDIKAVFTETIQNFGGVVSDTFEDETRLFVRSILPHTRDVAPHDRLQSGVALRASLEEILVSPYIFRLVCTNGAIMAHALGTEQITQVSSLPAYEVESIIRATIQACASEEVFSSAADQIRLARTSAADTALSLLPHLSRLPHSQARRVMEGIFARWHESNDRSRFALMNIVTATARDISDPDLRWRLEELGGRIGVPVSPKVPAPDRAAARLVMA